MKIFNYSKYKDYAFDNEILGYIAQIYEHKGRLYNIELNNKAKIDKLTEIAKIQSTEASNKIEGIVTLQTRIKQILNDKVTPRNRDEQEILGYRDVLNIIHESYDYIPLKGSYILQLHGELYKYSSAAFGGKFKNVQNYISEVLPDGTSRVRFMPLAPYETPMAMDRLCEEFNIYFSNNQIEPLILIPVFILDFLCIHPFNDGNGRMSRLLTLLLLYKSGFSVGKYVSIEKTIEQTKDAYYKALEESSVGWAENQNDPTSFIKYMLMVILNAYKNLDERVKILTKKSNALTQVQNAIQKVVGKFTKADIMTLCPALSQTTIERCFKELLASGFICKHGNRKSTFYTRN